MNFNEIKEKVLGVKDLTEDEILTLAEAIETNAAAADSDLETANITIEDLKNEIIEKDEMIKKLKETNMKLFERISFDDGVENKEKEEKEEEEIELDLDDLVDQIKRGD